MSEKMRDGFESWCLAKGYTLRPAETNCGIIIEGDYSHLTVQIAWQAWQASRAALVVELPKAVHINISERRILLEDDVTDALYSSGISYK